MYADGVQYVIDVAQSLQIITDNYFFIKKHLYFFSHFFCTIVCDTFITVKLYARSKKHSVFTE